ANREALNRNPRRPGGAEGEEQGGAGAGASNAPDRERGEQEHDHGEKSEASVKEGLDEGGGAGAVGGIPAEPAEAEDAVLDRVPRQERERDPAGGDPSENGAIHGSAPPRELLGERLDLPT